MNNYSLMAIAERIQRRIDSIEHEIQDMNKADAEEWTSNIDVSLDEFNERMERLEDKADRYSIAFDIIKDFAFEDLAEAFIHVENGGFNYDFPF